MTLEEDAWTDASAMVVLVDRMLEDGSMERSVRRTRGWVDSASVPRDSPARAGERAIIRGMANPKKVTMKKKTAKATKPPTWKPADELAALIAEWEAKLVADGHVHATRGVYQGGPDERTIALIYEPNGDAGLDPRKVGYGVYLPSILGRTRLHDASREYRLLAVPHLESFAEAVRSQTRKSIEEDRVACASVKKLLAQKTPARDQHVDTGAVES